MEQRLVGFQSEHGRLLVLQNAPMNLELEADKLRGVILAQEARVQLVEDETARVTAEERAAIIEIEDLKTSARRLIGQVQNQAYSKRDIERLKYQRGHLHEVLLDLRADSEKAEQEVWELNMQESRRAEAIGRLVRQVNESIELLEGALKPQAGACGHDLPVRVDLNEPSDALAAVDFAELQAHTQASAAAHIQAAQLEDGAFHEVYDNQRIVQEVLLVKERECRRLKERLEQLLRMREEYREWSSAQLDEAQCTAEATEDAVHAVSIGTSAPSIRDAAEIDKLRLALKAIQTQGANERAQLEEQIQRDEERCEDHRQNVLRHLDIYVKDVEALSRDISIGWTV